MVKKATWILISLTAAFSILVLGIFLGRHFHGTTIAFHSEQQAPASPTQQAEQQATAAPTQQAATSPIQQTEPYINKFNVNTVSFEQLVSLPGIGETLATRILDFLEANGPIQHMDQLLQVEGIGEGRLETLKKYLTTGG